MKEALIQLCDINKFGYLIRKAPNNTLSSTQINNEVCFFERDGSFQAFFIKTCGVIAGKASILAEGLYRCTIDTASIMSSFAEKPCNPIRWDPNALVKTFCSTVDNNTGSSSSATPHFNSTNPTLDLAASNSISVEINTPRISPTTESPTTTTLAGTTLGLGTIIVIVVGGSAMALGTIGGIIWYKYSQSSKNTATNFQEGLELSTFISQEDKESASRLLQPTLEKSNTLTDQHYGIPKSDMPVFTMPTEEHYDIPKPAISFTTFKETPNISKLTNSAEANNRHSKKHETVTFSDEVTIEYYIPIDSSDSVNNECMELIGSGIV